MLKIGDKVRIRKNGYWLLKMTTENLCPTGEMEKIQGKIGNITRIFNTKFHHNYIEYEVVTENKENWIWPELSLEKIKEKKK